jgi:antitoxin component YwqK of YwqJK toxin-antitoxin module
MRRAWYDNGQLRYEWNYINDKQHGIQQTWLTDGTLIYKSNFILGVKQRDMCN